MNDEQFKLTKEEFRAALAKVMKKGLDAVVYGYLPKADMIDVLEKVQPLIECLKGKFQEACRVNWSNSQLRSLWYAAYGWEPVQHCDCDVCVEIRRVRQLPRCYDKSCDGCKKIEEKNVV